MSRLDRQAATSPHCAPWSLPVPVARVPYHSLRTEHAELGVHVDLGAIAPFEVRRAPPDPDSLMWSDLQTGPGENVVRRLGSGRAGFYRGHYLKGVGRTTLAGNWSDDNDTYHGTGHLFPSAAIREFIATAYMRARGAEHLIVPCEGILVRPLDDELARGLEHFAGKAGCELAPVDRRLQAISVKPGGFARYSNINWLLGAAGASPESVATFAWLLQLYSGDPTQPAPRFEDCGPRSVARALGAAVERGVEAFRAYFRLGIWWGSYYNNFTLDGRFLDLEVPVIYGSPFVGSVVCHRAPRLDRDPSGDRFVPVGCELVDYAAHVVASIDSFRSRLGFLRRTARHPLARRFLTELLEALGAEFHEDHALRSRDWVVEAIVDLLAEAGGIPERVRPFVELEHDDAFTATEASLRPPRRHRRSGRTTRPEPMVHATVFEAIELSHAGRRLATDPDAELVNELIERLDTIDDPNELLAALADAEAMILRSVRPRLAGRPTSRSAPAA